MVNISEASIALQGKAVVLSDKIVQSYQLMRDGDDCQVSQGNSQDYHIAWYLVPLLVLLALAIVVGIGAMWYCMAKGMYLAAVIDVGAGKFLIGCA